MILPQARAALAAAITAHTTATVTAVKPGEDQALREAIWIDKIRSTFEWRSLGKQSVFATRNRTEQLTVTLRVAVYREAPRQGDAAEDAMSRCEDLLSEIEDALEADQSLGNLFAYGRVSEVSAELLPRDQGWTANGVVRIEAQNYP